MTPWIALLSIAASMPSASAGTLGPFPVRRTPLAPLHATLQLEPLLLGLAVQEPPRARGGAFVAPPCVGDVCQPRVSVPGHDPQPSIRGRRSALLLSFIDKARIEPIASIAWMLAASGVRVDYTPGQLADPSSLDRRGWGHVRLFLRWRIDAVNQPVFPERSR